MASEREAAKGTVVDAEENDPELEAKIAEAKAKADSINRDSNVQKHVHAIFICGVYLIGGLLTLAIAIWLYHHMVPTNWRFLGEQQIDNLQEILFSGIIGGAIGGQAKKISR